MNKETKVLENFIKDKELFNKIKESVLRFPFFYKQHVGGDEDKTDFCFIHLLYDNDKQNSEYFNTVVMPLLGRLNFNYLIRAKVNLYTKKDKFIETQFHVDYDDPHQVALYSLNTNNGYTLFEDGTKIPSVENQMILFDGSLRHASVAQTDSNVRVNININIK